MAPGPKLAAVSPSGVSDAPLLGHEISMDKKLMASHLPNDPALSAEENNIRQSLAILKAAEDRVLKKKLAAEGKGETVEEKEKAVNDMIAYFEQRLREPWYLITPGTKWMQRWDMITMLALFFTAIVTPYEVAVLETTPCDGLFWVNRAIDLVFICDMIMAFFTKYQKSKKEGGGWIKNLSKIRYHYVKSWFPIDIVSIIPFDLMGGTSCEPSAGGGSAPSFLKILRVIRILRLLKLLRVVKASRMFQRYEASISLPYAYIALIKFTVLLIMLAHWMACCWIMTGMLQSESTETWIDTLAKSYYCYTGEGDIGPAPGHSRNVYNDDYKVPKYQCAEPARHSLTEVEIYPAAIYWSVVTITSVGYGDITPQNADEMSMCTIFLLMSACLWAYIIGNATAIVSTGDPDAIVHHQTMDALNKFMSDKCFPEELRGRLRTFFTNKKDLSKNEGYKVLTEQLSPKLRSDVTEKAASWMLKLEFFRGEEINIGCVVQLAHYLVGSVYEQTETIPWDNGLFCCSKGVASRQGRVRTAGAFWGEDFILSSDTLKDKQPAYALTFVEVLFLEREKFDDVMNEWPQEKKWVRRATYRMAVRRGILFAAKVISPIQAKFKNVPFEHLQPELEKQLYQNQPRKTESDILLEKQKETTAKAEEVAAKVENLTLLMEAMQQNMILMLGAQGLKPVEPLKSPPRSAVLRCADGEPEKAAGRNSPLAPLAGSGMQAMPPPSSFSSLVAGFK